MHSRFPSIPAAVAVLGLAAATALTNAAVHVARADGGEEKTVLVKLQTNVGDIVLELDREHAPISVENFLRYVDEGYYDGTIFHRVIPGFMIQGGGYDENLRPAGKTHPPIKNEWRNGLKNTRGTIAMARTRVADSATSQFFINLVDNAFLDQPRDGAAYAVFGKVVEGMDVVDKIAQIPTHRVGPHANVPVQTVKIVKAFRVEKGHDDDNDHDTDHTDSHKGEGHGG
ncbi:MAG: peptidyl-prolyl cis-trans isomerase [Planctomycetota bacterium]|nr:MAG: peptidyl-prolyl cis-trans isomerase [Planctomycetota bacterium]